MLILPVAFSRARRSLRSAQGAFDLPSILTGVLVVAVMTLGVAALVFGAIPFTQNKASAQDLAAVTTAQGVAKVQSGRYLSLGSLRNAGYIAPADTLAVATDPAGTCFVSVSRSGSGQLLIATDQSPTPVELSGAPDTACVPPAKVSELAGKAGGPGPAPVMTTVWDTRLDPSCSTITLPLTGTINATIDWGDGTPAQAVTTDTPELLSRPYTGPAGIKTIRIEGTFSGWVGTDWPEWSYSCLTKVTEWGETGTTDIEGGFCQATSLAGVARIPWTATNWNWLFSWTTDSLRGLNGLDTSRVTSMDSVLRASTFTGDISSWDTSRVTRMSGAFQEASFSGDLSDWDTSQVTATDWMFWGSAFNGDISAWNTSSLMNTERMFWGSVFNGDISAWDTSNVTDMSAMFWDSAFNGDISRWNTSKVTTMSTMFWEAAFTGDLSGWDTSQVTDTGHMFFRSPFNGDLSRWDTSKVTTMECMFCDSAFNGNISGWNTSQVTNMDSLFAWSAFTGDLSGWDTSKVTTADNFRIGTAITTAHLPPGALFR